jgi:opacity protein-like surface antigen
MKGKVIMGSIKAFMVAGALAVAAPNLAYAADLLPPPPPMEPGVLPVADFGGWYLRGDVGLGIDQLSNLNSTFAGPLPPGFAHDGNGLGNQAIIGGGFGYKLNSWFRADITGEYRTGSKYWGYESYQPGGLFPSPACPNICYDRYNASVSSAVFLANGYVDLGTWYGVTPFVGAGIGTSYNMLHALADVGIETGGYGIAPDRDAARLAWALMAGFSYSLTSNLKLELGYRYLDMGSVASSGIVCNSACTTESQSFHMASQDIRLGLRYVFADVPPPPVYQAPLIRKY